ncbi:hypothetical protein [Streptomyces sp. NPDC005303]|uniref:hypothetical protein n=1 Tax=Streptomyces sp. NPDC005303 TaxID=3155713 RepID=UPI0033B6D643
MSPSVHSEVAHHRARVAAFSRKDSDPEKANKARRELKAAILGRDIRAFVSTAPLPTPEQLAELRALLAPTDGTKVPPSAVDAA